MVISELISKTLLTEKQADFLVHFAISKNVVTSAKQIGISRRSVENWINQSPTFLAMMESLRSESDKNIDFIYLGKVCAMALHGDKNMQDVVCGILGDSFLKLIMQGDVKHPKGFFE